jgi:hypothetical protein
MVPLPLHERLHAVKRLISTRAQAAKFAPSRDPEKIWSRILFSRVERQAEPA